MNGVSGHCEGFHKPRPVDRDVDRQGRSSTVFTRLKIAVLAPMPERERDNSNSREAGPLQKIPKA